MSDPLDALRVDLDALGLDVLAEPLGFRCRTCGGTMTAPDAPADPDALALVCSLLVDAGRSHAETH